MSYSVPGSIEKNDSRVIRAWVMYDWANSVFQLTIASAIFPIYYSQVTRSGGSDMVNFFGFSVINTVLYSWAIAAAYLLLGFLSPLFSAVADYSGRRKTFMKVFTWIGAVSCGMLFFFDKNTLEMGIIFFFLAWVGYGGSLVFYNSFLPVIANPEDHDRISARGYSMGYLGGVVLLMINLIIVLQPAWFGIIDKTLPAKIAFVSVFLWWIGFSQITFLHLPKYTFGHEKSSNLLLKGYSELRTVWRQLRKSRTMVIFLISFFFLTSGVLTVMFMAATYGEKELHLSDSVLIGTILCIQLLGVLGAWSFARLSKRMKNIPTLIMASFLWVFVCIAAYYINDATGFILVAALVGLVMGGTQSLARSTYSKMLPETRDHTSFFSFYDVMEKLATVAGLFSFGIMEAITGNMRYSVLSVMVFFVIGLGFLLLIRRK
ncbi:MAG: MFS transporter [Bacteroidetes bacterium]|nr:MFS transporter [Bacteroidota bacterium]